jgi:hypothetical protein
MKAILSYFARKSHNVRIQVFLALFYGLLSIFGVGGTLSIIMKIRKQAKQQKTKAVKRANM